MCVLFCMGPMCPNKLMNWIELYSISETLSRRTKSLVMCVVFYNDWFSVISQPHCIPLYWTGNTYRCDKLYPDSKVHGAKMGPTWVLSAHDGPHVGPMNLAIRAFFLLQWLAYVTQCAVLLANYKTGMSSYWQNFGHWLHRSKNAICSQILLICRHWIFLPICFAHW